MTNSFCRKCGNKLNGSIKFCERCGTTVAVSSDDGGARNNKHVIDKRVWWVFLLCVVAVIITTSLVRKNSTGSVDSPEQVKCSIASEKAFELFKQTHTSTNFPEIGDSSTNKKDETASIGYKFNYDSNISLCFIEYIISMKATTIDTNETLEETAKIVSALVSDINKQQSLAGFATIHYPTGSQTINACGVKLPGHYDDINNMPIKDLFSPTQCSSESEFDSLVSDRFGIK